VDQCTFTDGWHAGNRQDWSSGAGHTVTESVFWNTSGGIIDSRQYGWGYIIGTENTLLFTMTSGNFGEGTEPQDYVEGTGSGDMLEPASLYEDQLSLRLGP